MPNDLVVRLFDLAEPHAEEVRFCMLRVAAWRLDCHPVIGWLLDRSDTGIVAFLASSRSSVRLWRQSGLLHLSPRIIG